MKSSKFRFLRLVALVIVMAQLLSLSAVVVFATSNDEILQQTETVLPIENTLVDNIVATDDLILGTERELKPVISSDKFTTGEEIQIEFDTTEVVDYYYVTNGVAVTEASNNSMQFELVAVDEFGSIDVYADYGNGELVKSSIYTYKQDDVVYVSDISKDRAWYNCMEEQYNQGLLSKEEWNDLYSELSQTFIFFFPCLWLILASFSASGSIYSFEGFFQRVTVWKASKNCLQIQLCMIIPSGL